MFNQAFNAIQQLTAIQKVGFSAMDPSNTQAEFDGVISGMMKVIQSQNLLIAKLMFRQAELTEKLEGSFANSGSGSDNSNKVQSGEGRPSNNRQMQQKQGTGGEQGGEQEFYLKRYSVSIVQNKNVLPTSSSSKQRRFQEASNSSDEQADSSSNKQRTPAFKKKQTETKNMVKNFSKAIFSYIRKNKQKRAKVLSYLGISDEDFMRVFDKLRGRIHSITEMRSLWLPEGNIYHKAFRILSCEYLRKSCLQRTFNSRVQKYGVHLKYRHRLMDSLRSPEEFMALKTS